MNNKIIIKHVKLKSKGYIMPNNLNKEHLLKFNTQYGP